MKTWTHRLDQSSRISRTRRAELLPLPEAIRDVLSLEYHLQLEALRAGAGALMALQVILRVALAASMLRDLGYGGASLRPYAEYEERAAEALAGGIGDRYCLNDRGVHMYAALLTEHDAQLSIAPLNVIDQIARRLERYRKAA
ncbi:hypothetical protein ABH945_005810 [Paraburkholderia sp. GAS333]|uniref:Fis family transcriptional regulator n=1 Tax=Paraburkholderia sp. GAS333 TaxID=3156279 RepID=UPI003D213A68